MNDNLKERFVELKKKIISFWSAEGKWEKDNPNSPLYGLDKDPIVNMLITAMAYQESRIDDETETFRENMVGEFEEAVLPYHVIKATPAMSFMTTAKIQGLSQSYTVGTDADFVVQKETFSTHELFHFQPLFESNIIEAEITSVNNDADGKVRLSLLVADEKVSLNGVGFFFRDMNFDDVVMRIGDKEVPLIKPWQYDNFPMNPDFSYWNVIYNKSLLFGAPEQWHDLWASQDVKYYMVDPSASNVPLDNGVTEIALEFKGLVNNCIGTDNVFINSFPVVNVSKKSFTLSSSEPIVKISCDNGVFMNFVGEKDTVGEADKFILRRYGCERFGLSELMRLIEKLQKKSNTDFYAYQLVPSMQDGDKMNKLRILVKDITSKIKTEAPVDQGIYALLKEDAQIDSAITLKALFTNGAKANGINAKSLVTSVPSELDIAKTRLLMATSNGRDEVEDNEEKKTLSHYYSLTNDRIVTRNDLKMFCVKELMKMGFRDVTRVELSSGDDLSRTVTAFVRKETSKSEIESAQRKIEKLIEVHSSGLMPVKVRIVC